MSAPPPPGAGGASDADSMKRMKTLLESYYGVGGESQEARERRSRDLNSSAFDADVFVRERLLRDPLPALLQRDEELVHQIKTLDSDMQLLVYDNYSKFISATDTIRSMRHNVSDIEGEIAGLVSKMEKIRADTAGLNDRMSEKRGKIEKLVRLQSLVKKLTFLFELPERLRQAIEMDALPQAVLYYTRSAPVLAKYKHVPSFASINGDAKAIIGDVRAMLQKRLSSAGTSGIRPAAFDECVSLLLQLGDPRVELAKKYLEWHEQRLLAMLSAAREVDAVATASPADGGDGDDGEPTARGGGQGRPQCAPAEAFVRAVNDATLDPLMAVSAGFYHLFLPDTAHPAAAAATTPSKTGRAQADGVGNAEVSALAADGAPASPGAAATATTITPAAATSTYGSKAGGSENHRVAHLPPPTDPEVDALRTMLINSSKVVLGHYIDALREHFLLEQAGIVIEVFSEEDADVMESDPSSIEASQRMHDEMLLNALRTVITELRGMSLGKDVLKATHLGDRATEVVELALRHQVAGAFGELRRATVERLKLTHDTVSKSDASVLKVAEKLFEHTSKDIAAVTRYLNELLAQSEALLPDLGSVFESLIRFQLHHWFVWLCNALECQCDPFHPSRAREGMLTRAPARKDARRSGAAGESGVGSARFNQLVRRVSVHMKPLPPSPRFLLALAFFSGRAQAYLSSSSSGALRTADTPELVRHLKDTSGKLLRGYVAVCGEAAANLVRGSIEGEDWLRCDMPTDVRPVTVQVLNAVAAVARELHECRVSRNAHGAGGSSGSDFVGGGVLSGGDLGVGSSATGVSGTSSGASTYTRRYRHGLDAPGLGVGSATGAGSSGGSGAAGSAGSSRAGSLQQDIERMFSRKVQIFGPVEFTRDSIVCSVLKLCFKTMFECLRECTLGREGFQQVQVDAHFYRAMMPLFVDDVSLLNKILQEVITSARDRCLDPVPLETAHVDALSNAKREEVQLRLPMEEF